MTVSDEVVPPLAISLLGRFCVRVNGSPLPRLGAWRQQEAIFALLILRHPHPLERAWLAGWLWPECAGSQGLATLRRYLTDLRRALGPEAVRVMSPTTSSLVLDLTGVAIDLLAFDAAVARGDPPSLEQAVALYQGPLLEGWTEEWVFQERQAREQAYVAARERLAALALERGDTAEAEQHLRRAIQADPLRESSQRALMQVLAAGGNYASALLCYRELRLLLHRELNAEPDAETQTLFQQLRSEARRLSTKRSVALMPGSRVVPHPAADAGAADPGCTARAYPADPHRSPEAARHNLPLSLTRFIGREEEIARLCELLVSAETRLLTLLGPGGTGKTRLAIEVGASLSEAYHGAVWFVPLADLSSPPLILGKIRDMLGLPVAPGAEPLEQVAAFLLSRQASLLLLDNFEHLVAEGPETVRHLLERVPTLTCLVTSRQRLGLAGEREFLLSPLPVPGEGESPERLVQCASVRLFVDRAQAVRPDFQVTPATVRAVARLCARLEGLPLAIELAAGRIGVLTPAQMAGRLSERFELLVSRQRDAGARHQSLRAALEWSYELLAVELQRFFAGLSVFRGGCSLEAAEAVGEEPRALDYLEQLRECTLVQAEEAGSEMRFRLLETLREYGAEQLGAEERDALGRRHARYYLSFVEEADTGLLTSELEVWLARLRAERENVRAALAWAVARQETETALRLGGALRQFWWMESRIAEGRSWLEASLQLPGAAVPTAPRALALCSLGQMAWVQGDFEAARAALHESIAIWREQGDKVRQAHALIVLGWVEDEGGGHLAAARAAREESLALYRGAGYLWGIAQATCCLGRSALEEGDRETARRLFEEGVVLFRAQGDPFRLALPLIGLGNVAMARGDHAAARRYYEECLAIRERYGGHSPATATVLSNLAYTEWCLGDWQTSIDRFEACIELRRRGGILPHLAGSLLLVGRVAQCAGQPERAAERLRESLALFREQGDRHGQAQALIALGRLAGEQQGPGSPAQPGEAVLLLREGLTLAQAVSGRTTVATGLVETAALLAERNPAREGGQAARLLGAAEAILQAGDGPVPPYESARLDQQRTAVRGALGEAAFRAGWVGGQTLTMEQAVTEAMQALEREAGSPAPRCTRSAQHAACSSQRG